MIDIRVPATLSADPAKATEETRRFLFQLVEQLNKGLAAMERRQENELVQVRTETKAAVDANNPSSRWNEIKALIIKSADIITAYSEEISASLASSYVAQSAFGTYTQQMNNRLSADSGGLEARIHDLESINSEWYGDGGGAEVVKEIHGVVKAGVLYYDGQGNPVVGVEIGQRNEEGGTVTFDKFARFTSDRLSFYDAGGNEVAYISDMKLIITQAEITELKVIDLMWLGQYRLETDNGLAVVWED